MRSGKYLSKQMAAMLLIVSMVFTSINIMPHTVSAEDKNLQSTIYEGEGYEVIFRVTSRWADAFNANVTIKNTGDKVIDNWALGFHMPCEIKNIWNGVVAETEDSGYVIKNDESNQDIAVGKSVNFGFEAVCSGEIDLPDTFELLCFEEMVLSYKYEITLQVTDDWESGYSGQIHIKNISDELIEDWRLEFDFADSINRFSDAKMLEHNENRYCIKNTGYNANIKPDETITLGFSGTPGNVTHSAGNFELFQIVYKLSIPDDQKDTDNDGLTDLVEKELGTDYRKADTDKDGIPDGYEYYALNTNPLEPDTDNNGVNDSLEDFDNDRLINIEEYKHNTDPYEADTDNDGLSDYEELNIHHTDPLKADTDEDGINDGDEIILGLNPLSRYTTEGISDSEVCTQQTVSEEKIEDVNSRNPYDISIDMKAAGLVDSSLQVDVSQNEDLLQNNAALLGDLLSFSYGNLAVDELHVTYAIDPAYINKDNRNFPGEQGLEGVQRYQVFCFDENQGALYPVNTEFDLQQNEISFTADRLGNYCVIDMDAWMYQLGMTLDDKNFITQQGYQAEDGALTSDTQEEVQAFESVIEKAEISKSNIEDSELEMPIHTIDELPENYDQLMLEQIYKVCGIDINSRNLSNTAAPVSYQKPIDLVFLLDTSGSMNDKLETCKQQMSNLVSNLYASGIVANVAIISFCDYRYSNILYEIAKDDYWAKNPIEAKSLISKVKISDYGGLENDIDVLEDMLSKLSFRNNTTKFAILLSDEPLYESYNVSKAGVNDIAQKLKNNNIITSVVCYNNEAGTFAPIYTETDGIQTSISGNFLLQLETFIQMVMRKNDNYFYAVSPIDLSVIHLSKDPDPGDLTTNDDGDLLVNSREIDWKLIRATDTAIELPTLYEYWNSLEEFDYDTFSRFAEDRKNIINSIVVLPLKSDPTKDDTDGDGYLDHVDPRPLKSDVTYYKIKDAKYVSIVNPAGGISFGGSQGWFPMDNWFSSDYIINYYGCGTIAASDLFLYFALRNSEYNNLYTELAIKNGNIDNKDYMNYVRCINALFTHTPRFIGVPGSNVASAINAYFSEAGIKYKAGWPLSLSSTEMLTKMKEMLEKDIPVIFSVGPNTPDLWGKAEIKLYLQMKKGDEGYKNSLNELYQYYVALDSNGDQIMTSGHYMTITDIIIDDISTEKKVMLRVSSWGREYYIDYDEYREYIKDESGTWTSSIVYIK